SHLDLAMSIAIGHSAPCGAVDASRSARYRAARPSIVVFPRFPLIEQQGALLRINPWPTPNRRKNTLARPFAAPPSTRRGERGLEARCAKWKRRSLRATRR